MKDAKLNLLIKHLGRYGSTASGMAGDGKEARPRVRGAAYLVTLVSHLWAHISILDKHHILIVWYLFESLQSEADFILTFNRGSIALHLRVRKRSGDLFFCWHGRLCHGSLPLCCTWLLCLLVLSLTVWPTPHDYIESLSCWHGRLKHVSLLLYYSPPYSLNVNQISNPMVYTILSKCVFFLKCLL